MKTCPGHRKEDGCAVFSNEDGGYGLDRGSTYAFPRLRSTFPSPQWSPMILVMSNSRS